MKDVGEDGGDGEDESQHVEPEGSADRSAQIFIRVSVFSLRKRSCSRRAANPMAATTTSASGLKKADRLV